MHSYHALPKIAWNRCWSIKYGSSKFARKFVCCQVAEIPYSGKLSREKTFANWRFSRRKLSWIARLCRTKGRHALKFRGENFRANSHKTAKFAKVFSLESFPLYGIHAITIFHFSALVSSSKMPEKETQLSHMQLTKRK